MMYGFIRFNMLAAHFNSRSSFVVPLLEKLGKCENAQKVRGRMNFKELIALGAQRIFMHKIVLFRRKSD